jgi:hypothetical protein
MKSSMANARPRRGGTRQQPGDRRGGDYSALEAYHRATGEAAGFILLLVASIFAGIYAAELNTSTWFSLFVVSGTVAGLGTGLGVALMEASILLLITGKAGRSYLKRAQVQKRFMLAYHARRFLLTISEERIRLISVLIIGTMAPAYWIARPLYLFNVFEEGLPEYLALSRTTPPQNLLVERNRKEETDNTPEEGREDEAPEQPQFGNVSPPVDTNGQGEDRKGEPAPAKPATTSNLPVSGKILPIDVQRRTVDPVYLDLADEVRPQRPDEVGAIAALWWSKVEVGSYSSSNGAFQQTCTVMVWDKRTKSLLAERSFAGGMPARWSLHGFPQKGSKPYAAIRDFLNGLPHR